MNLNVQHMFTFNIMPGNIGNLFNSQISNIKEYCLNYYKKKNERN